MIAVFSEKNATLRLTAFISHLNVYKHYVDDVCFVALTVQLFAYILGFNSDLWSC